MMRTPGVTRSQVWTLWIRQSGVTHSPLWGVPQSVKQEENPKRTRADTQTVSAVKREIESWLLAVAGPRDRSALSDLAREVVNDLGEGQLRNIKSFDLGVRIAAARDKRINLDREASKVGA